MKETQETEKNLMNYILVIFIAIIMGCSFAYKLGKDTALQNNREEKTSLQYNKQ